jgi:hypothetical protein
MDQKELQQKIAEYYQKLSPELQEVFASMKWMDSLKEISTKYSLNDEQTQTLGIETTLLLLGILHVDDYEKNLFYEMKLSEESFNKILSEVDEKILKSVKLKLVDIFEKNAEDLVKEKYGGSQKLDERFGSLSEDLQEAVRRSNYQEKVYEIGQKYKLPIDQLGILEEIVTKTIIGDIRIDKLETELKEKIKLPGDKINELINDINNEIFKDIRRILKAQGEEKKVTENRESIANNEGEVPLPPYNEEVKNEQPIEKELAIPVPPIEISKNDKDAYAKHGIELIEDDKVVPRENGVNEKTDKNILEDSGIDIIGDKLIKPTVSSTTTNDYSLPKISSNEKDPYREDF